MSFHIGQEVVCVDVTTPNGSGQTPGPELVVGSIYTIEGIDMWQGLPGLHLAGVPAPCHSGCYHGWRFRPVEYKAMALFRRIAASPTIKIREDA